MKGELGGNLKEVLDEKSSRGKEKAGVTILHEGGEKGGLKE